MKRWICPIGFLILLLILSGCGKGKETAVPAEEKQQEIKKAEEVQTGPDGKKAKLPLKPIKRLKITIETKDANGSSSSSSQNFVAEKDGKLVIPVPATVK